MSILIANEAILALVAKIADNF